MFPLGLALLLGGVAVTVVRESAAVRRSDGGGRRLGLADLAILPGLILLAPRMIELMT